MAWIRETEFRPEGIKATPEYKMFPNKVDA